MKRFVLALGSIAAMAACAASSAPQKHPVAEVAVVSDAPPPSPPAFVPLPDRHAKITFDLGTLAPLPFVHGTLAGRPAWMIVDSGASTHAAMSWMADRAKLPTHSTKVMASDHVRHDLDVSMADRSQIVIDGWGGLTPGDLLVVGSPRGLASRFDVGLLISPQMLDDDRPVIFELDRGVIRTGTEADAVRALAARKIPIDPDDIAYCHDLFSVAAVVEGHAVRLAVDTGASSTDLFSLSEAGRALASRSIRSRNAGEPASGPVAVRIVKGVHVQVGGLRRREDIDLLVGAPDTECPVDGVLGVDVLRSCVLVFGPPTESGGRLRMQCGS